MPIRPSKNSGETRSAYCPNCDEVQLDVALARFTLHADEGFGEVGEDGGFIKFFTAICNSCGYMELYRDGFLFKSNEGDA